MEQDRFLIRPADLRERDWALGLALQELDREQQALLVDSLLPFARRGIDPLATLMVGCDRQRIDAAAWVQPQIGKSATLWIGVAHDEADRRCVAAAAAHALVASRAFDLEIVQLLADPADSERAGLLSSIGMIELAQLHYFEWHVEWQLPRSPPLPLEFETITTSHLDRLGSLIAESYAATLDCPALSGLRSTSATIAGYQAAGDYDPALWFCVKFAGEPAAVLLLTPYVDLQQWELTYLGVLPRWRGKGIGRALVAHAQQLARQASVDRLVLAADAANKPATLIYRKQGFRHWADRVAWYCVPSVHGR